VPGGGQCPWRPRLRPSPLTGGGVPGGSHALGGAFQGPAPLLTEGACPAEVNAPPPKPTTLRWFAPLLIAHATLVGYQPCKRGFCVDTCSLVVTPDLLLFFPPQ
jgi:hypothetical protein